ncbi:alpha/beta fold hydrolase [Geodermatophilus sp. SYSU D00766]
MTGTAHARGPRTGYAPVNGLRIYHEVHGPDQDADPDPDTSPVLLLHGAYMTTGDLGPLVSALAATRRVVVPDLQAHGRTADVDRPITYEGLADDAAGLLAHLGIERADVMGFSMGGAAALQVAIRHPEVVRTLAVVSASHASAGMQPELLAMIPGITPEVFAGSPMEATYRAVAPDPGHFPVLVEKLKTLDETPFDWPAEDVGRITAPTLLVAGDADAIRLEHVVELFRLLGGGAMGDLSGLPRARLAILPGTTHFMPPGSGVLDRLDWLVPMLLALFDAPQEGPEGVTPGPAG